MLCSKDKTEGAGGSDVGKLSEGLAWKGAGTDRERTPVREKAEVRQYYQRCLYLYKEKLEEGTDSAAGGWRWAGP